MWHNTCSVLNCMTRHMQCAESCDTTHAVCWIMTQRMECAELCDTTYAMYWIMWQHIQCAELRDTTHAMYWIVWHNTYIGLNHVTTHAVCWIARHYMCRVLNHVTQSVQCAEPCVITQAVCWITWHMCSVMNHMTQRMQCAESGGTARAVCWIAWHNTCTCWITWHNMQHVCRCPDVNDKDAADYVVSNLVLYAQSTITVISGWCDYVTQHWLIWFSAKLSPQKLDWRGPRSQEVGEEWDYTYRYTVTTRMIPVLRQAATRAILMFQ